MFTRRELKDRLDRLTEREVEQMQRLVGDVPKCSCTYCRLGWSLKVNRFLRAVEAANN